MRWTCLTMCALALGGCNKPGGAAGTPDTTAAADARTPAPASTGRQLRLADLAGTWTMTATNAANDSVLVTYTMTATADSAGWSILYPNHATPIALRVHVDADSVIMDAGPYASTARKGAMVTIHSVSRLRDGQLVGTMTARYTIASTESVVHISLDGHRS
ncbi:MAG TPA: hypothetical protein VGR59_14380 [Gemmatimonadaceae bacterium]|nr:hypothetical protein [Gemmatimonadaceae bacterium]